MDPAVLQQLPPPAQASFAFLAPIVHQKTERLRQGGFVNYYGLQRFGKTPFLNYETGRRILRHEYGDVVDLFIGQQSQLHPTTRGKAAGRPRTVCFVRDSPFFFFGAYFVRCGSVCLFCSAEILSVVVACVFSVVCRDAVAFVFEPICWYLCPPCSHVYVLVLLHVFFFALVQHTHTQHTTRNTHTPKHRRRRHPTDMS